MKKTTRLICIMLLAAICTLTPGCTRNDGDIGNLFGTWSLRQIIIDGTDAPDYEGGMSWSFQNDIVWFITVGDHEDSTQRWAKWAWKTEDEVMLIDFIHGSDGEGTFSPDPVLHFPDKTTVELQVLNFQGKDLTLCYTSPAGARQVYVLRKLD